MKKTTIFTFTAIYMAFIAYMSLRPSLGSYTGDLATLKEVLFNLSHLPAYAVLMYLLMRTFRVTAKKDIMLVFGIAITYGILMEGLQMFVPSRSASFLDVTVNTVGCAVGYIAYMIINRMNDKKFVVSKSEHKTQDSRLKTQPGPRTQDTGPRTQDLKPRTQPPGHKTQDTRLKTIRGGKTQ